MVRRSVFVRLQLQVQRYLCCEEGLFFGLTEWVSISRSGIDFNSEESLQNRGIKVEIFFNTKISSSDLTQVDYPNTYFRRGRGEFFYQKFQPNIIKEKVEKPFPQVKGFTVRFLLIPVT